MPQASVWFLRAALVHLLLGFAAGGLLLAQKGFPLPVPAAPLLGAHRDLVLVGWMAQCALGVAWWILPKHPREPVRGPEWPARASWWLVNGGVVFAAAARPAGGALAGYLAMGLGTILLVGALLPRVKAFGR